MFLASLLLASCAGSALAVPSQGFGNIWVPPQNPDTGIKMIPDEAHPWRAPGPDDQRGPCPALNTLANHGYLPRNGIVSLADVVEATGTAFNMDAALSSGIAAFAILTRGNVLLNKLSIGGESPLVPPLPGAIDGTPGGLAKHGRFEGDVSMTRYDAALGNNKDFQPALYANMLEYQDKYGDGNLVNDLALGEYKSALFNYSMANNSQFSFHTTRETFSFGEAGFIINFFANGTEGTLSVDTMTSFFANESFPQDWYRHNGSVSIDDIGQSVEVIENGYVPWPGAKNASGVWVDDNLSGIPSGCGLYYDLIQRNVPTSLLGPNSTKQIKANTQELLGVIYNLTGQGCPVVQPGNTLTN